MPVPLAAVASMPFPMSVSTSPLTSTPVTLPSLPLRNPARSGRKNGDGGENRRENVDGQQPGEHKGDGVGVGTEFIFESRLESLGPKCKIKSAF